MYGVSIAHKNVLYYSSACFNASSLGVSYGGKIPDSSFSATSIYNSKFLPKYGRLNHNQQGWAPNKTNNMSNEYLQIDLGALHWVCGVATQGDNGIGKDEWTTKYKISLSLDDMTWNIYQWNGSDKVSINT